MQGNVRTFSLNQMMGTNSISNDIPSSKPLQIFLLVALLVTGAAYMANEWSKRTNDDLLTARTAHLLHTESNHKTFVTLTALGRQAEETKNYADAVADYRRALFAEATPEARVNLGRALFEQGDPQMAISQFKEAAKTAPSLESIYTTWGQALAGKGKLADAQQVYQDALRYNQNFGQVHFQYAMLLERQAEAAREPKRNAGTANSQAAANQNAEAQLLELDAAKNFAAADKLGVNTPEFQVAYGSLLNQFGIHDKAEALLTKAVKSEASLVDAQFQLAVAQDHEGKYSEAIFHYEATLGLKADDAATLNNLALIYATAASPDIRSAKMAVQLATRACEGTGNQNPRYLDTLARSYAANGDFFQAIMWEDKAVHRATELGDNNLLREFQPRFNLYRQHRTE